MFSMVSSVGQESNGAKTKIIVQEGLESRAMNDSLLLEGMCAIIIYLQKCQKEA